MYRFFLYASAASSICNASQVASLFARSRARNQRHALTGFILYDGRAFLQYLEGDAPTIDALYERIVVDPLHNTVRLLEAGGLASTRIRDFRAGFCETEIIDELMRADFGATQSRAAGLIACMSNFDLE